MSQQSDFTKKNLKYLSILAGFALSATLLSGCTAKLPWVSGKASQDQEKVKQYVKGLEEIEKFPNSEFLYKDQEDTPEVKKLLSSYSSAYKLTNKAKFADAIEFYKQNLKKRGWSFIQEVSLESKTQKPGFYWKKNEKGLRIHTQINDIWYSLITEDEATTGLAAIVALESKEYYNPENLVKLSTLVQTNWDIDFPDSWDVKQQNASYSNGLDIIFKYTLGGFEIRLQDLGTNLGTNFNSVAENYLKKLNAKRKPDEVYELEQPTVSPIEQTDEELVDQNNSGVSTSANKETTDQLEPTLTKPNPEQLNLNGNPALELRLIKKDTGAKAFVTLIKHPRNNRFYAIVNIIGDKEFYEFLKSGLR